MLVQQKYLTILLVILAILLVSPCLAQFADISSGIPDVKECALAWGDFDSDGDLDLAIAGTSSTLGRITRIYRNTNGTFSDIGAGLTAVTQASLAWGDFDNDGDLDLVVGGSTANGSSCIIYRNDNGSFSDYNAGLPGVSSCPLAWGDYDNDGDLDLAISSLGTIYRNDRGKFVDIGAGMARLSGGGVGWADYDCDGDLDIGVTGADGNARSAKIYRNDAGVFVDAAAGLANLGNSGLAWGDFDNDGDPDLALVGYDGSQCYSRVLKNNGGKFTSYTNLSSILKYSSAAWGDYDNDGDLDLAITGDNGSTRATKVYKNTGTSFTEAYSLTPAVGYRSSCLAWADFDNDGDLDLAAAGDTNSSTSATRLYRNGISVVNTAPSAPTGLSASNVTNGLTLSWAAATDTNTPSLGLTYNIRLGTHSGMGDVVCVMSNPSSGARLIPQVGNARQKLTYSIAGLPRGTYYWSVQSIDTAFCGSAWAAEQTVAVNSWKISGKVTGSHGKAIGGVSIQCSGLPSTVTDDDGYYEIWVPDGWSGTITPKLISYTFNPYSMAFTAVSTDLNHQDFSVCGGFSKVNAGQLVATGEPLACGDYDNDGDLDLAVAGGVLPTKIYRNDGGLFADIGINLVAVSNAALAWGDYDSDGDLDLVMAGLTQEDTQWVPTTKLYRNDNGVFTDTNAAIAGVRFGAVTWGDYDNDGDLDLAIAGISADSSDVCRVYRNDEGVFTDINAGLTAVERCSMAWADFDNDGDLDLVVCGSILDTTYSTKVYRNDNGAFVDTQANLPAMTGSVACGDFDSDGDVDLALSGPQSAGGSICRIYRNENGSFNSIAAELPTIEANCLVCADYDNDGDVDLIASGKVVNSFETRIMRNDGAVFSQVNTNIGAITGRTASYMAVGDYDGDGDLDLAMSGTLTGPALSIGVFRNDVSHANSAPNAPTGLTQTVTEQGMTFGWTAATDDETPSAGLSYNLRVGSAPGRNDIVSGMSDCITGKRSIAALGNAQKRLTWTIKGIPAGEYYWSVQAIDASFAASPWAAVGGSELPVIAVDEAKQKAEGQPVSCAITAVTAVFGNVFYVEKKDRSSAIRVEKVGHNLKAGDKVAVQGTTGHTASEELCIFADRADKQPGSEEIMPIMLNNRSIGGSGFCFNKDNRSGQAGIAGVSGLNNIGLLIQAFGQVTAVGSDAEGSFFYIDDGSCLLDETGNVGVRVRGIVPVPGSAPADWNPVGKYVTVTGISSCFLVGPDLQRLVDAVTIELLN